MVEGLAVKRIKPVSRDMGERLAREIKAVKYVECSVRSQKQLKDVFDEAICRGQGVERLDAAVGYRGHGV